MLINYAAFQALGRDNSATQLVEIDTTRCTYFVATEEQRDEGATPSNTTTTKPSLACST